MPRYVLYRADVVTISNQAIRLGDAVYPISHLASVRLAEPPKPNDIGPFPIALTLLLTAALFVFLGLANEAYYLLLVSLGCVAGVALMIREAAKPSGPARREPPYLHLQFTNGDSFRITGDETTVRMLHEAAVNAIGLANG